MDLHLIEVHVDGRRISLDQLGGPCFGWGRERTDLNYAPFVMRVPSREALEALQSDYETYADENEAYVKDEDRSTLEQELRGLGWPPLLELLARDPRLLRDFIMNHVVDLLVCEVLGANAPEAPPYYVWFIDDLLVDANTIEFRGRVALSKLYDTGGA